MSDYVLPVIYPLLVWWGSTGVVLFLDGMPARTFRWSMLGVTVLMLGAMFGLAQSSDDTTVAGAYFAFTCGVMAWAWQEMSFLTGFLTGPRKQACPHHCRGWRHFGHGIQAILYHEFAIIVMACAVAVVTWRGANHVGLWTFMILWAMRQSAKLNLFLGVRNLSEEFLPDHLRYLERFFRRKAMNPLFPVSVSVSTIVAGMLVDQAMTAGASPFQLVGSTLLATLLGLGILEHWFMVLPLPSTALWKWSLKSRRPREEHGGPLPSEASVHDTGPLLATQWQPVAAFRRPAGD